MSDPSCATNGTWDPEDECYGPGCDCTRLCDMGPTCPGGMLAGLPGSGCARMGGIPLTPDREPGRCTCGFAWCSDAGRSR